MLILLIMKKALLLLHPGFEEIKAVTSIDLLAAPGNLIPGRNSRLYACGMKIPAITVPHPN
jgi:hypothetical protein